ncbi:DHH family phosphoesterase [Lentiprolixibacter aurantiacus]|uniref:Bifunctional oligoribonuclease/PAP phosphatase NrnA n=1 Tax=Lentiprolixibacter aurantiacus TaxID=2993939 RepID=A0AAE3MN01_9FLAO|nr:bifunctional oligoribonuclease/PAP phosphatase NrnA [Lentiprolixibacter aurantiacus]MCX2720424.1 bifunctional oligoribonuclease/PAP phosphatase NrnA [Lentiprolixibacter aurantiacus]
MNLTQAQSVQQLLSRPQKIAIVPHKNPDGDAIGSSLGLCHYLQLKGHEARVIVPNDFPKFLKWIPGTQEILIYEWDQSNAEKVILEATVVFTLDFNDLSRSGAVEKSLQKVSAPIVMIDHHQAPHDYASITYSDVSMSSTAEMVYNFIEALGDREIINADIANCLYAGILTDTGSFKFASTTSRTHRVVADLIDKGASNSEIHNRIFDTNTPDRLHLLGCALNNMVILPEYNTAYITLSQDELDANHFRKGDTEGFVNYGLTLENIRFAVIFIENRDEGIIKISFRSEGEFSVNEFARAHFQGGGHTNAAGGKSELSMEETTSRFVALLDQYKSELAK